MFILKSTSTHTVLEAPLDAWILSQAWAKPARGLARACPGLPETGPSQRGLPGPVAWAGPGLPGIGPGATGSLGAAPPGFRGFSVCRPHVRITDQGTADSGELGRYFSAAGVLNPMFVVAVCRLCFSLFPCLAHLCMFGSRR